MLLPLAGPAGAQTPSDTSIKPSAEAQELALDRGAAALWQSLKKLGTRASLLLITAHPDDEDGGMLTYESRGRGARVALLTLNRGEGGANLMSRDFFDALGLIRSHELLAADRYYGVEQYWTRVVDYGFSKTLDEAVAHWGFERVLADVVRVIRITRPLVVASAFVGGPSDGHGHHQMAGVVARAAFRAAGDPNAFPEQIAAGLRPWAPLKNYARVPFFGSYETQFSAHVEEPHNTYDPVLGATYEQIAREGLGLQKSQHGGPTIVRPGQISSAYHRFAATIPAADHEKDFYDGIDVSLRGLASLAHGGDAAFLGAGLARIEAAVAEATAKFSAAAPERSAPALAAGAKETLALIAAVEASDLDDPSKYDLLYELDVERAQFNAALAEALGLSISATVAPERELSAFMAQFLGDPETFRAAVPGQSFTVAVQTANRGAAAATLVRVGVESEDGPAWSVSPGAATPGAEFAGGKAWAGRFAVRVPDDAPFTRPYFHRPHIRQSYYDIDDEKCLGLPFTPYPLAAWAEWRFDGTPIRVGRVVQTVKHVIGAGSVLEPLAVAPAVSVAIAPRVGVTQLGSKSFPLTATVRSNVNGPASGVLRLELPPGWRAEPSAVPFQTTREGEDRAVVFTVMPGDLGERRYEITAVAEYEGRQYREGFSIASYPGLRPYFLYAPSTHVTRGVDIRVAPELRIGYVQGTGDDVPASLERLGVKVNFLGPADIASGDLSSYDAILLGIRAYAARAELAVHNRRLLDYVKDGGVLIVQYNTPEFDRNFGPYPFSMTQTPEQVTDEASKVRILTPQNPVFAWPNEIDEKDFEGWVEERGSKFMNSWDPRYEALLETHDPGQDPQEGGLLYAHYGRGLYIYDAYAFYRQLPEGVPGAYRIFANLVSLPKNPRR